MCVRVPFTPLYTERKLNGSGPNGPTGDVCYEQSLLESAHVLTSRSVSYHLTSLPLTVIL